MLGLTLKLPSIGLTGSTTAKLTLTWENQDVTWENATATNWEDAYGKLTTDTIWIDAGNWESVVSNWENYI